MWWKLCGCLFLKCKLLKDDVLAFLSAFDKSESFTLSSISPRYTTQINQNFYH
jgi:hypothetical protein